MTYAIVGASAGVGRALADAFAEDGHGLVLAASDPRDLAAQAEDLRLRHSVAVTTVAVDFAVPSRAVALFVDAIRDVQPLDGVLFPIGYAAPADDGMLSVEETQHVLNVNLGAVISLTAVLLPALLSRGRGSIVAFGSIAAARGRRRNATYAAAKRGLKSYVESLLCVTRGTGVEVQLYELGWVATGQTLGRSFFPPAPTPEHVAARVVRHIGEGSRISYLPGFWKILLPGIRLVPRPLFCRLPI
jgi:short-subunit dehydrogenase